MINPFNGHVRNLNWRYLHIYIYKAWGVPCKLIHGYPGLVGHFFGIN